MKKSMKTLSLFMGVVCFLFVPYFGTQNVMANGGPHGSLTANTDSCVGCHRSHLASSIGLLMADQPGLCLSCHDGSGASTDVLSGIYQTGIEGTPGAGLRGGGFWSALMDVALDGSATASPVTSTHQIYGTYETMWGNGAIGSGAGTVFAMTCGDCHNPHGESSYRILRPIPDGSSAGSPVIVPDQSSKNYTVASASNQYLGENYGSQASSLSSWCAQCHTRYLAASGSGHTDSGDAIFMFRHNTISVPCTTCHVTHGTTSTMGAASGSLTWPDDSSTPSGDERSSLLRANNRAVCVSCHVIDGRVGGGSCDSCHGAPPESGAHLAHSSADFVGYGQAGASNTATSYVYGCGECHPGDDAFHQDGTVQVDLNPATASPTSLKQKNAAGASFNGSTCGGVYCHSGQQVSSGVVGNPLRDASNQYILDSHGNLTYAPYTVAISRSYATTPAWEGGNVSGNCTDCHAFPLQTTVPEVQAGVGDTHQWVDDWGYGNLHAYNMSYSPIQCKTCHYGEITATGTTTRNGMDITTYNPVPLADQGAHANGQADVVFNTVDPVVYPASSGTKTYSLSSASYNVGDKSCANVACHLYQSYVVWGSPYRWWNGAECDLCHRKGLPIPISTMSVSPEGIPFSVSPTSHPVFTPDSGTCTDCHTVPHGK